MRARDLVAWAGSAGVLLVLLGLWALASASGWVSRVFLPSPVAALEALSRGLAQGELLSRALETTQRMLLGWLLVQ